MAVPDGNWFHREKGNLLGGWPHRLWLALVSWALWAANSPGMGRDATRVTYPGSLTSAGSFAGHRPCNIR